MAGLAVGYWLVIAIGCLAIGDFLSRASKNLPDSVRLVEQTLLLIFLAELPSTRVHTAEATYERASSCVHLDGPNNNKDIRRIKPPVCNLPVCPDCLAI